MIATKRIANRNNRWVEREPGDYQDGYQDGFSDASRIMEGGAFFEIGLAVFCLVAGAFFGWAVSGL